MTSQGGAGTTRNILHPEAAFGLSSWFDGLICPDIEGFDHDFIYCCGTQIVQYNPLEKKSVFIPRGSSTLMITCFGYDRPRRMLAVGEKVFAGGEALTKNAEEKKNAPIADVAKPAPPAEAVQNGGVTAAATERKKALELDLGTQITVVDVSSHGTKTLIPPNRNCVFQNIKFLNDGARLLTLSVDRTPNPQAQKNQRVFDYCVQLWNLPHERVIQSVDVRNQLLSNIYPVNSQFLLVGPSYLRVWNLEPMKELDAFFSLKQEKALRVVNNVIIMSRQEYIDNCAKAVAETQMGGAPVTTTKKPGTGAYATAGKQADAKSQIVKLSPEEIAEYVLVFIFSEDGTFFKFKMHIKTNKTSMLEAGNVIKMLEKDENWGVSKKKADESDIFGFGRVEPPKPHELMLTSIARWGTSGFLLGGTKGYLGLLKFNNAEKLDAIGPFWVNNNYNEAIRWVSDYKEHVIPKKYRDQVRVLDTQFKIPPVIVVTAQVNSLADASMPTNKNKKEQQKSSEILRVVAFPVHQRDLISGGQIEAVKGIFDFHFDSVLALQIPRKGPKTLFSVGNDNQLKSWSYPSKEAFAKPETKQVDSKGGVAVGGNRVTDRKFAMELQEVFEYDAPISIAVHPDGRNVVVIFLDRMRFYYACYDCVRQGWELALKQPSTAQFSNGGDLLAVSTMSLILLIDITGGQPLIMGQYTGHLNLISQMVFSEDDKLLMSCGQDGCIYGWEIAGGNRVIEHVNKGSVYLAFCYDARQEMVVAVSREGDLRMIRKDGTIAYELKEHYYTSLLLAPTKKYLVAGTIYGSIRVFDWPLRPVSPNGSDLEVTKMPSPDGGAPEGVIAVQGSDLAITPSMRFAHVEVLLHTSPVTSIALSSDMSRVFSGDESGTIVCCAIKRRKKKKKAIDMESPDAADALQKQQDEDAWERLMGTMSNYTYKIYSIPDKIEQQYKKFFEAQRKIQFPNSINTQSNLDDYILCSRTYLEDKLHESQELMERIDNVKNDAEYTLAQKDQEVEEKIRQLTADNERTVLEQKERYDMLADKLSQAHHYHAESTLGKAKEFENNMRHVEREQEAKLSKEYEKQNRLLNEIQALREKNRLDLVTLEESYEAQIAALKKHNETAMREWRAEYDKVCAVLKTDGLKFEEAMKQQENEYETEISDFLDQRRHAQQQESEKYYLALRDSVSIKNTNLALQTQIKQQREELQRGGKAQEELKRKLEEAVEMFRKVQDQLKERDKVIRVKDETLQKLRSNQKHLESFRYVLFHKVQTLERERDPLEEQVGQLKDSVQGMYQEMVSDLRKKQALETKNIEKHFKIQNLVSESNVLARNLKATRKDFKNMISEVIELAEPHSEATGGSKNDINQFITACKDIVRRYQNKATLHRSAQDLNDEEKKTNLPLITSEAIRQRDALVNKSKAMLDTNKHLQTERANDINRLTKDNSDLILEMNRLRHEKTLAERKITDLENSLYSISSQQAMSQLKTKSVVSSSTPYIDRKRKQDSEQERLARKRDNNQLPPKLGDQAGGSGAGMMNASLQNNSSVLTANSSQFEREGFNVDRLRDQLPLQSASVESGDNTIYTGGPIPPANKFPAARK